MQEMWVWSPGQEDPLEEEMAAHSSILAWEIPRTEEPSGLQPMGLQRVGHDGVIEQQTRTYIELNYLATHQKLAQHCEPSILQLKKF